MSLVTPGSAIGDALATATASVPEPQAVGGSAWARAARKILKTALGAVASIVVLCGLWQLLVSGFHLNKLFTRGPLDVWRYINHADGAERHLLIEATRTTARDAAIGFAFGTGAAVLCAIVFNLKRGVEQAVMPVAMALRSVPLVAMTPVIALIFGRSLLSVTIIAGIVTFFPTLVNLSLALRSVPAPSIDLMQAYGASRARTLWKVQLPSSLPSLFASARIAAPLALIGALLAEWLTTGRGLGYMMLSAVTTFEADRMWTGVAIVTISSIVLYSIISGVEQIVLNRYAPERLPGSS
ncbi:MAG: binding-protein-dependent transport system inner rane component [Acidimicrobiales bacterium]|nr:binding-protein-dependent transport system inner rane component [Acidimicrobiales bacterium]